MCQLMNMPRNFPEFFYRLVRGSLFAFTFILCIFGLTLITFAFWYIYEGKNYHLDNSIKFSVFAVSFILGLILFILATCGLIGVLNENLIMAKGFILGIVILILAEIGCIFIIYSYKHLILSHASYLFRKFISEYADDPDISFLVDTIQSELKCCGISSPDDWDSNPYYNCSSVSTLSCSVPSSCCYGYSGSKSNEFCGVGIRRGELENKLYQVIYVSGCKYSIYSFLDYKHKLTSFILIGVLVPQFICVVLVLIFIILLHYLIHYESLETENLNYVVRFARNSLNPEINAIESRKSLFFLDIGDANGFKMDKKRLQSISDEEIYTDPKNTNENSFSRSRNLEYDNPAFHY